MLTLTARRGPDKSARLRLTGRLAFYTALCSLRVPDGPGNSLRDRNRGLTAEVSSAWHDRP
jgi:hypothetical protein